MRRLLALLFLLLAATPAAADMYQDGSNAKLPEAVNNLAQIPGAVGDGVADDTAAVTAYLTAMAGRVIKLDGKKKYRLTSPITIPSNTTLDCQASPGVMASGVGGYAIGSLGGLRLETGATVTLSAGARIQHCSVLHAGLTWPQPNSSAYAGTALTFAGGDAGDAWVNDVLVVGFETCLDVNASRKHLVNVEADCINAFKIGASLDTSTLHNLRAWPWGTAFFSPSCDVACLSRSGTAFLFSGSQDHTVVSDLLAFRYNIGIELGDGAAVFDGTYWSDTNGTAIKITTTAPAPNADFHFASIQDVGGGILGSSIVLNSAGSKVHIGRLAQWKDGATADCVQNNGAELHITYAHIVGCMNSAINTTAGKTTVISGSIGPIGTAPYIKIPGTGAPSNVVVNIGPAVIADNPFNLVGAGKGVFVFQNSEKQHVGLGTVTPDRSLVVSAPTDVSLGLYNGTGNRLVFVPPYTPSGSQAAIAVEGNNSFQFVANGQEAFRITPERSVFMPPVSFSTLTACSLPYTGSIASIVDSTTNVWGATITGGGGNHVIGYCGGAAWTVMAK